ncbi:MAG: peptidase M3 [Rhodobacterales bacterium]|nr:MAG: peptidase M3 [Rhodobacterales bacterium]
MTNPLLSDWHTPFELPPFDQISDDDFAPAFQHALQQARANIAAIADNPQTPSFANTIEALEQAGQPLRRVLSVFYNLASTDSNLAREQLQREFSPKLAAYSSEISLNQALFARVETLWQQRDQLELSDEQQRVLLLSRRSFVRAGAQLQGDQRDRLKQIVQQLAVLGTRFGQNLLEDERNWVLELSPEQLDALPDFLRSAAAQAGQDMGRDKPVISLARSLVTPLLQSAPDRALRQQVYQAFTARGANGGETDNREIAAQILALRAERAALLGYDDFASYRLDVEMAKTPENVRDLLMQVWQPAKTAAERDQAILTELLHEDGINGDLEPWDWRYYAEKRRQQLHDLDESRIKPYFQLDRMIEAAFDCANRLFGLEFAPMDASLYHPDARAWEVTRGGEHLAVFIGDYFARPSKRSGAWCSALREQKKLGGEQRPVVLNICNFNKSDPALLSFDDARTLFHEFGHALHQMLSDVTYGSISGTSVARDFVELPSQLFEHWLQVPEVLQRFATHVDTGQPMPADMLKRLLAAGNYDMGFQTVEYLASALVDLEFHNGPAPVDPMARQADVLAGIGMPDAIAMRHATPQFAHVFSGDGYASAYYSYMWSEVMDADAFEAFEQAGGPFDPQMAKRLEQHILSAGGTKDPAQLYEAFRGQMPTPEALLRGRGLI